MYFKGFQTIYENDEEPTVCDKCHKWLYNKLGCETFSKCCKKQSDSNNDHIKSIKPGPLNRQDIFFSASLTLIPEYLENNSINASKQKDLRQVEYHLSSLHVPFKNRSITKPNGITKCWSLGFTNVLRILIDVSLLKSWTFITILIALFFFTFSLYTPYIFVAGRFLKFLSSVIKICCINFIGRASDAGIPKDITIWFISLISLGNTVGRVCAGLSSFLLKLKPEKLAGCLSIAGGILTGFSTFFCINNQYFQISYCVLLGFCTGKYLICRNYLTNRMFVFIL